MITKKNFENIEKLLKKHNQGHLLAFWEQLDPIQRQNLLAQIEELDFSEIDDWVASLLKKSTPLAVPADFAPAWSYRPVRQSHRIGLGVDIGWQGCCLCRRRRAGNTTGIR